MYLNTEMHIWYLNTI